MAENLLATWERGPMLHGPSATWSTPCTTTDVLEEVRETSGFIPYGSRPQVLPPIMGSGLVYPDITEIQYGVQGVDFATNLPATKNVLRDMFALFFNALTHTHALALDTWAPHNAAPDAVTWLVRARTFATVGVDLSGDATQTSAFYVDTAFPSSVTVNIPNNTPATDGGFVNLDVNWVGNLGLRDTDVKTAITSGTTIVDIGEFYRTQDCTFGIGTDGASYDTHKMVSATINFTNGAVRSTESTGGGESVGVVLAPPTFSGTVTLIADISNTASAADGPLEQVLERYESTARTLAGKGLNFAFTISAGSICVMRLPVAFAATPTYTDVGGIQHMTIPFVYAGDKTIGQASALEVDTWGGTDSPSPYYTILP